MINRKVTPFITGRTGYSYYYYAKNKLNPALHVVTFYDNIRREWNAKEWKEISPEKFEAVLEEMRHEFPSAHLLFLDTWIPQLKAVMGSTVAIQSFRWYPQFHVLVFMGDGFPMARFILDDKFENVYCAFLGDWRENRLLLVRDPQSHNAQLSHMSNPQMIPHVFPVSEFIQHFKKVRI